MDTLLPHGNEISTVEFLNGQFGLNSREATAIMGKQILVFYLGSISQMTGFFGMWGPASGMWRPAGGMSREAAKVLLRSPINCYMPENNAMHLTSHWGAP